MVYAPNPIAADMIESGARALAAWAVQRQSERAPESIARFGAAGASSWRGDTEARLTFLANAVAVGEPSLFTHHVAWSRDAFRARGVPEADLDVNLGCVGETLADRLPPDAARSAAEIIDAAQDDAERCAEPTSGPAAAPEGDAGRAASARYLLALLEGRRRDARGELIAAVEAGSDRVQVFATVIRPALEQVGALWQRGELTVADEHAVTAATAELFAQLGSFDAAADENGLSVLLAGVSGDLHALALLVAAAAFERAGWRVHNLGADVPIPDIVQGAADRSPDLIGLGAALGCHVRTAKGTIDAIRADPRTATTPVLIGGTPFVLAPRLYRTLGADAAADRADRAPEIGLDLVRRAKAQGPTGP